MNDTSISYYHRGGDTPLLGVTIYSHFLDIARQFPQQEAIVCIPQQRRLTYAELEQETRKVARGLLAAGFGEGDRIGIWSTNNVEWLVVQLATAAIGAILVNINPAYRTRELAYALKKSEVQGVITIPQFRSSNYIDMLLEIIPELKTCTPDRIEAKDFPDLRQIVVYEPDSNTSLARPATGFALWHEIIDAGNSVDPQQLEDILASLDFDDPINIQYTSGTTGFPKAVLLTHHNILNNAWYTAQAMHFDEKDRLCVAVPFYHCFGMVLANLLCLAVGACIVVPCDHFEPGMVLKAIDNEKCTAIHGVPTMFVAELEHPDFSGFDLSSLRTGIMAGAPCPPELMTRVINEMHCKDILIGYGQTEASPLTHLTTREDSFERRIETVGKNLPHQEVKIVSTDTGHIVPLGEIGEVCFRGYHIMQGYYGAPEATHKAIDEHHWLYSGDLGTMDADGYVRITGRLKEMIIRGGENIYPREIEDFLFTHPKISEVAVFGVSDEFYGEEITAWIQLHAGESMTEDEVREFCKDQIAHFKIPKYIRFVDEFPITITGKLQKFKMREMMETELTSKA